MKTRNAFTLLLPLVLLGLLGNINAQSITVTKPATGSHFCNWGDNPGTNIDWAQNGAMHAQVKIELFNASGTSKVRDIVSSTANNGTYYWPLANSTPLIPPDSYVVKVTTLDNLVTGQSGVFVVDVCNFPGPMTFTVPTSGAMLCKGSTYKVKWQVNTPPPYHYFYRYARLTLLPADQQPTGNYGNVGTPPTEQGEFDWTIPASTPNGAYKLWLITVLASGSTAVVQFNIGNCLQPQPWWKELAKKLRVIRWRQVDSLGSGDLDLSELHETMVNGKEKVRIELMSGRQLIADLGQFGPGTAARFWQRITFPVSKGAGQQTLKPIGKALVIPEDYQLVLKNMSGEILHTHPIKLQKIRQ